MRDGLVPDLRGRGGEARTRRVRPDKENLFFMPLATPMLIDFLSRKLETALVVVG